MYREVKKLKLSVNKILEICHGSLLCGDRNLVLNKFSKDTRTIKYGDCYIGIKGENFDGNTFWHDAVLKGAKACILDSFTGRLEDKEDITIILVEDSVKAIQLLAGYVRSALNIPVIAVTGSVGKTSTKDLIASVLQEKYKVLKSPGNLNGQIGLPLNILEYHDEEVMVLEMGMNDFGQIKALTNIAKPTIGVITNIGTAHIGILGSKENILNAKLEILEGMEKGSPLLINYDDALLKKLDLPEYSLITCGSDLTSMYNVKNIEVEDGITKYLVCYNDTSIEINLPIMGEVFAKNSLFAVAIGQMLGLSKEEIKKGLENISKEENHLKIITLSKKITFIDDTYNSNYEAVVSALKTLLSYNGKRHIAVLGDILELEEYAKDIHEQIGSLKEILKLDALFLCGNLVSNVRDGAVKQGYAKEKIYLFSNIEELKKKLEVFIKEGDVLLFKASHAMNFQKITKQLEEVYRM